MGGEVLEAMLTWDAVHCIAPVKVPELTGAQSLLCGEGREESLFLSSAVQHPPGALCASCFSLSNTTLSFEAILKASVTSQPLHSSHRRKAGKQRREELAGKGGVAGVCEQREEPVQPAKTLETWRQRSNGSTATVHDPVLAEGNASCCLLPEIQHCPAETRPLGTVGPAGRTARWWQLCRVTGSQPGCLLGEGDILPRAMRTKGNN